MRLVETPEAPVMALRLDRTRATFMHKRDAAKSVNYKTTLELRFHSSILDENETAQLVAIEAMLEGSSVSYNRRVLSVIVDCSVDDINQKFVDELTKLVAAAARKQLPNVSTFMGSVIGTFNGITVPTAPPITT